jgi:hypothetical protein
LSSPFISQWISSQKCRRRIWFNAITMIKLLNSFIFKFLQFLIKFLLIITFHLIIKIAYIHFLYRLFLFNIRTCIWIELAFSYSQIFVFEFLSLSRSFLMSCFYVIHKLIFLLHLSVFNSLTLLISHFFLQVIDLILFYKFSS